ncbi:unnamed protein product [Gongylonema pulchrum]|uniref:Not3 domain-containing protein n=1 Tax=Gongylonema pulchrum TaxID=637853 RepID=A0A183E616_9BILA|nr:unnamed protein product [Gongylonema pulchrum]
MPAATAQPVAAGLSRSTGSSSHSTHRGVTTLKQCLGAASPFADEERCHLESCCCWSRKVEDRALVLSQTCTYCYWCGATRRVVFLVFVDRRLFVSGRLRWPPPPLNACKQLARVFHSSISFIVYLCEQLTCEGVAMAEKRKLLNEIDKCFKKVEEGVELFEETMAKMQEANSDNQREKFQDDLKKEIKKLQRLRDQIKGWQNSSDIKDKDKLTSYRKLIEQRMEQFKDIERENKTKPHSKQGLSAEEKLDPREKEKAETVEWLQIRCLEDEADKTESQIESLSTADQTRKKGKRDDPKKGEKERLKRLDDLRKHLERIRFHVSKLEICMRLVNNETLESKKVMDALREPFELYIEALDPEGENDPESFDPETTGDALPSCFASFNNCFEQLAS